MPLSSADPFPSVFLGVVVLSELGQLLVVGLGLGREDPGERQLRGRAQILFLVWGWWLELHIWKLVVGVFL